MSNNRQPTLFFCGVGGSGMSPLAAILKRKGARVLGSDRAYDQEKSLQKFKTLTDIGIELMPQDGSGVTKDVDAVIVSTAVEDSIPDIKAAKEQGVQIRKRAELLAEIFNASEVGVSIAGTSGKSTVTGMIATVLTHAGLDPTVMNGGVIRNFDNNMRIGNSGMFVTETDESDGSIGLYNPEIAVLNNVALDHKSLDELETLFGDFITRATRAVVLNFDDEKLRQLSGRAGALIYSYGIKNQSAQLCARDIEQAPDSIGFKLYDAQTEMAHHVTINQPGLHNVSNALACLCACKAAGLKLEDAITGLEQFTGIKRRLEVVGTQNDITVIDDFAHNPDKISATLSALKTFDGRLLVIFQPHGFGPLKLMGREIAESFGRHLEEYDLLLMTEPFYVGGTAEKSMTSQDVVSLVVAQGVEAMCFEKREEILPFIKANAKPKDRIIVMGARDDSLSDFAAEILSIL